VVHITPEESAEASVPWKPLALSGRRARLSSLPSRYADWHRAFLPWRKTDSALQDKRRPALRTETSIALRPNCTVLHLDLGCQPDRALPRLDFNLLEVPRAVTARLGSCLAAAARTLRPSLPSSCGDIPLPVAGSAGAQVPLAPSRPPQKGSPLSALAFAPKLALRDGSLEAVRLPLLAPQCFCLHAPFPLQQVPRRSRCWTEQASRCPRGVAEAFRSCHDQLVARFAGSALHLWRSLPPGLGCGATFIGAYPRGLGQP